ncbi:MAG: class I SAM-dependent methyltransferase [Nocardioides sp.]
MPNPYPVLYRLGFTPWEEMDDVGPLPALLAARPPGRALDAGCGSGRVSVMLAAAGWEVTGVDSVHRPLKAARARAASAGVADRATFVHGDVTRLDELLPRQEFDLVVDVGCLHGMSRSQQRAFADSATAHTRQGADLVVLAVARRRGIGPSGLDRAGVTALFGAPWALAAETEGTDAGGGPLRGARFRWYHLHR